MKKIIIAIATLSLLSACASTKKSTAPMPTDELVSIGQDASKGGSYNVALASASKFCDRWDAAPSIIDKEVMYQGELEQDTQTAVNVVSDIARIAGKGIFSLGSDDAYETKLKYKCY